MLLFTSTKLGFVGRSESCLAGFLFVCLVLFCMNLSNNLGYFCFSFCLQYSSSILIHLLKAQFSRTKQSENWEYLHSVPWNFVILYTNFVQNHTASDQFHGLWLHLPWNKLNIHTHTQISMCLDRKYLLTFSSITNPYRRKKPCKARFLDCDVLKNWHLFQMYFVSFLLHLNNSIIHIGSIKSTDILVESHNSLHTGLEKTYEDSFEFVLTLL